MFPNCKDFFFPPSGKFLGNQVLSYGQNLTFSFRVDRRDTRLSAEDLVLEGAGLRVSVPLIAQGNSYPSENVQTYTFRYSGEQLSPGLGCLWPLSS